VVAADETDDADVVKQAGEDGLLRKPVAQRVLGTLQQVGGRGKPELEEINQRRFFRHLWQPLVGTHQEIFARVLGEQFVAILDLDLAVRHAEQHRLGRDFSLSSCIICSSSSSARSDWVMGSALMRAPLVLTVKRSPDALHTPCCSSENEQPRTRRNLHFGISCIPISYSARLVSACA